MPVIQNSPSARAGFTSAIILAMIALLIGYESVSRIFAPVAIHFREAIPIACLGLAVNIASAWLLSGGNHHHGHGHEGHHHDESHHITTEAEGFILEIFEDGAPPRFRLRSNTGRVFEAHTIKIETARPDGAWQRFRMVDRGGYLESLEEILEPHAFVANLNISAGSYAVDFVEHEHGMETTHRHSNMRAGAVHVIADAAVSALVIGVLLFARAFGWLWMDPLAGIVGSVVIVSWSYSLIRDTGSILLDMNPNRNIATGFRQVIESENDELADLRLWRLGPGHLGAIVSVVTTKAREADYYRARLARFQSLSHLTVEVLRKTSRSQSRPLARKMLDPQLICGHGKSTARACDHGTFSPVRAHT